MKLKFSGSLIGLGIGDSLGAAREGSSIFRKVTEISPRYTDDTAMMIGMAESLIECDGFDGAHMAENFVRNYTNEPWRGYGMGPPRIFRLLESGHRWNESLDRKFFPGGSFGNGSAMRIAPIGLLYYDNPEKLREIAYQSSRITHSHSLGTEGAALQAYAVSLALREEENFLREIRNFTKAKVYVDKIDRMEKLLGEKRDRRKVVRQLGNGIEAFNSVPTAIFSFLASSSFEEALVYAVSLGGDTDTIGAMTGAIAGAWWGLDGVPLRWRENLENCSYIERLAAELWKLKKAC